jgi:polysaccharide biosynthesis transport protein
MTLHALLKILRDRWLTVVGVVVVLTGAGAGVWFLRPAEYTADLRMYVSAQSADNAQAAFQGAQLSQQRVTSYVELVGSKRVSEEVIRTLRLSTAPEDLAEHVAASSKLDSVIIDVAVTDGSAQSAAAVANAIGQVFPQLVDELERPSSPTGIPPVAVRVVQPAEVPDEPSSASLHVMLVLGLVAGLLVGVCGALFRNALDTSVKTVEHLRAAADTPVLGTIAFDSGVPKRPLTLHEDPQSPRAEAFRQLRTNLQFLAVDSPPKVIAVTSSLPSEGKTTTVANLAIALASSGHRVLVIEADLRRPKLADLLGVDRTIGLTSVLAGRVHVAHAVQHWSGGALDVLPSGPLPPNPSELLASQHMASLLQELRAEYDIVLLDTPPVLPVTDAAALAPSTDGVLIACRFKKTKQEEVALAASALRAVSAPLLGSIFSMATMSGSRAYGKYNAYYSTSATASPGTVTRPHPEFVGRRRNVGVNGHWAGTADVQPVKRVPASRRAH